MLRPFAESCPQPGQVTGQHVSYRPGRGVSPYSFDEPVGAHALVGFYQQDSQHAALPSVPDLHGPVFRTDLDRT
jgi:hypothetical protein